MLSGTSGIGRSFSQGIRQTDNTKLLTVCPHMKRKGKCAAFNREANMRRHIAAQKERELLAKAIAMYGLQLDLLASTSEETGGDLADAQALLQSLSANGAFSADPADKSQMIGKLVDELKQEPAYQHWNLEAEVAAQMVRDGVRHCPFSHRLTSQTVLKRDRAHAEALDTEADALLWKQLRLEHADTTAAAAAEADEEDKAQQVRARQRVLAARAVWAAERGRVFEGLTPFQKCVCCLLWQQVVHVPRRLLIDVRRTLEKEVEARGSWPGHDGGRSQDDEEDADALDAYLESAEFDALVKKEEARIVEQVVCRPELGVVNLSSLPKLVVYAAETKGQGMFSQDTLAFFTTPAATASPRASANKDKGHAKKQQQPLTTRALMNGKLTTKEVDVSHTSKADELAEALEWMCLVFTRERDVAAVTAPNGDRSHTPSALQTSTGRLVWRSLTMCRAELTQAEPLITALHKRGLERHLLALDLSHNRLTSLRFLFYLRAHYGQRLLRLSLRNNLITRKPEYQEQVRLSLPKLTSLDGEPIRRPPMPFPRPRPDSFTLCCSPDAGTDRPAASSSPSTRVRLASGMLEGEARTVLDCLARLCYIWETRRIPHTQAELAKYSGGRAELDDVANDDEDGAGHSGPAPRKVARASRLPSHVRTISSTSASVQSTQPLAHNDVAVLPESVAVAAAAPGAVTELEQELDEDNFPHRYLHPSATYSFTAAPELVLFDPETMRLNKEVELDDSYDGMRLNTEDFRAVRVFDVALRNSSRNLLQGRPALQRSVRGASNCYMAYQFTLYPESLAVDHHLDCAVISIHKMKDYRAPSAKTKETAHATTVSFGSAATRGVQPTFFLVTVHGYITWRAPSMHGMQTISAAYDRTLTLVEKVLNAQNRTWEKLRSPKLVVYNDHFHLRPHTLGVPICYTPSTFARLARLVVEFGLEACADGVELVRRVMELARTDAAEYAALDALVFGPPPPLPPLAPEEEAEEKESKKKARAGKLLIKTFDRTAAEAARVQLGALIDRWIADSAATISHAARRFVVVSQLDRVAPEESSTITASGDAPESRLWGGSNPHTVPLAMVHEVVNVCNELYAALKLGD